jgi:hypothetical protein
MSRANVVLAFILAALHFAAPASAQQTTPSTPDPQQLAIA